MAEPTLASARPAKRLQLADRLAGGECLDICGVHRLSADPPVPAGDLFDDHPRDGTHVLALDLDHRVGHLPHDVLLLRCGEHAFDDFDIDEWHFASSFLVVSPTV
jgi:hypothetical protein